MLYLSRYSASEGGYSATGQGRRAQSSLYFFRDRGHLRGDDRAITAMRPSAGASDTQIHPGFSIRLVTAVIDGSLPRRVLLTRRTHRAIPLPLPPSPSPSAPRSVLLPRKPEATVSPPSLLSLPLTLGPSYPFAGTRARATFTVFRHFSPPRSIIPIHHLSPGNKIREIKLSMCHICAIFETSRGFEGERRETEG